MKRPTFKNDEYFKKYGLTLSFNISFVDSENKNKMELLSCTINDGYNSTDYAMVIEDTTLIDVIKEFIKQ